MIIYLYGLPGAGKNYIGNIISKNFNFYFKDADEYLPKYMKDKLKIQEQFTYNDVEYYHHIIAQQLINLSSKHNNIVICQASFFQKHRNLIKSKLTNKDLYFVHINANKKIIINRLKNRNSCVTPKYMHDMCRYLQINQQDFQINNNYSSNKQLIEQCNYIFRKIKLGNYK